MGKKRYQLRYAGGQYWLLDMKQEGFNYKAPISFNETGMYIYQGLENKDSIQTIAENISHRFEINIENALRDVNEFILFLEMKGILSDA